MSINISNFTVTADNSNIKEENRTTFDGVFIQSVSIIKITADISSSSRNLSRVMVLINNIVFDVKDINSSSYKYEIGYTLTDSYIGSNLDLEIIVTAINTEGYVQSSQPQHITVYPYSKPKLIPLHDYPSISVYRATIDGSPNDEGTKAVISAQANTQISLNNVSLSPKVYIRYKNISASWSDILTPWNEINLPNNTQLVLADSFFTENAYNVQLKVEDKISSSEIYEFVLPSESITFDAPPGGKKYAIGGSAKSLDDNTFGVYWKTRFFDEIDVKKKATFEEGINVAGDSLFNDNVEIKGKATFHNAYIKDCNLNYVVQAGTVNTLESKVLAGVNIDISLTWTYRKWKDGMIELRTRMNNPFIFHKNYSDYLSDNELLMGFTINRITYPEKISFSSVPQEFAKLDVDVGLAWLGVGFIQEQTVKYYDAEKDTVNYKYEDSSQNTRYQSSRYYVLSLNDSSVGYFSDELKNNSGQTIKVPRLNACLDLKILGPGTITE